MSTAVLKSVLQTEENENNPLLMSDEQILEQIYSTHVHSDTKFDVDSLLILVENTLRRSTNIVDNVVQGSQASVEHVDDQIPRDDFNSPLCTLKSINSEMACKPPSEEVAHKTTLTILNKLSKYDWDAKAVFTLAAFALEYGQFWLLTQHQPTDLLAKSVAMLNRVPGLTKPAAVQKHRQAIIELNTLVKTTLQVTKLIYELEKLITNYDIEVVPALGPVFEQLPVDVYWTIITIAAIVTQINILTTESEEKQELSHYGQKINIILSKLRKQISLSKQQIEEVLYYEKLKKVMLSPSEISQVFQFLIFPKDVPQQLFDGATQTTIDITVLNKKNVYLFISTLDITDEEISVVRPVYDSIKTNEQYKIVWIPIVEEWNEQTLKKYEVLKTKVPWYVGPQLGNRAGKRYIKEEWHFTKKPLVVLLSTQGKVENTEVFDLIQAYGVKAFPFRTSDQKRIENCFGFALLFGLVTVSVGAVVLAGCCIVVFWT